MNVRGMGTQLKRQKVFEHLNKLQADIVLLQETHTSTTAHHTLTTSHFPHTFSACYNSRQRGVAILIRNKIQFSCNDTITDPEGRFIIIQISLKNIEFCIANVYGPNIDDPSFFHNFFSILSAHSDKTLIVGGDLNIVLNPQIDKVSKTSNSNPGESADTVKQYMSDFGLCDVWRSSHPALREYTFFSTVHHSYSRLDYFLASNSMIKGISDTRIHPITISDHAPVSVTFTNKADTPPIRQWRFNTSLLKDPDFIMFFKKQWEDFLHINDLPGISPCVLWETAKVVMRGQIISYSSHKAKIEKRLEKELEDKIKTLETAHAASQEESLLIELRKLRMDLNKIINQKIQFQLQRLRLDNWEHGNKSSKLLANLLKQNKEKCTISSIKTSNGTISQDPQEINNTFREFYQTLYSSQKNPSDLDIDTFLNTINLPKLTEEQIQSLEAPILIEELHKALQHMSDGKAPGPDGYPVEFYKEFWPLISPTLFKMIVNIKESRTLPPCMNCANISLLLKPEKDPTLPSSYRPISLINVDLKIISKTLASRIEKITPHIIHPDQTGFIKGRHSTNNTRRLINLIDHCHINKQKAIVVSLDAEKAFDRVNWKFLIATLQKFGFRENYLNWIKILYDSSSACVKTNDQISRSFNLERGTRQGCPLSPSLFALFIEPLATAIRQNTNIKGIQTANINHKISLYADDVLLFLTNAQTSLHKTIALIDNFSSLSEYSINWSKSVVLPINSTFINTPRAPLKPGNIKYLGINISAKLSDLVHLNYTPLIKTIKDDLTRWITLPISLMGRIATIKMMILPKINYMFSMIPTAPPKTWFNSPDSHISIFLWKNKTPRISLKTLQNSKDQGGLELPHIKNYYLANKVIYIQKWINQNPLDESWLDTEKTFCGELRINDLPFLSPAIKKHSCFTSTNISTSLSAWWEFLKITGSSLIPCKLTPIWNNPDILQRKKTINFPRWQNKGIRIFEQLMPENSFIQFSDLVDTYGLSQNNYLEYLQLKSIIQAKFNLDQVDLSLPLPIICFLKTSPPKQLKNYLNAITLRYHDISPHLKMGRRSRH